MKLNSLRIARIIFLMIGCIFPIFIGGLHTATHFGQLLTPDIEAYLQKEIMILGQPQSMWNTWGVVSFMMGVAMITVGLLNTVIYRQTPTKQVPPRLAMVTMLLFQCCVLYVGYAFEQPFQLYGGVFGLVLMGICLGVSVRPRLI